MFRYSLAISILTLFFQTAAWSLDIDSSYIKIGEQYKKVATVQCMNDESVLCSEFCGNPAQCVQPEPYCLNCAGTTWSFLRAIFTQPGRQYVPSVEVTDAAALVQKILSKKIILVDTKSVFNYYTPIQSEALVRSMIRFCPEGTQKASFAIALNQENIPVALDFVICKSQGEKDLFFSVRRAEAEVNKEAFRSSFEQTLK